MSDSKIETLYFEDGWHFVFDGTEFGPVTATELKWMAANGRILSTTLIRRPFHEVLVEAKVVDELFDDIPLVVETDRAKVDSRPPIVASCESHDYDESGFVLRCRNCGHTQLSKKPRQSQHSSAIKTNGQSFLVEVFSILGITGTIIVILSIAAVLYVWIQYGWIAAVIALSVLVGILQSITSTGSRSPYRPRSPLRPQNGCICCGYTWFPRGHDRSSSCPRCG